MPLVFGGAPLVNVLVTMVLHPPKSAIQPDAVVGFLLASAGPGWSLFHADGMINAIVTGEFELTADD